jgi:hypothetical protein
MFFQTLACIIKGFGALAVMFDGSGKFLNLNHRTFFFLMLDFVRGLGETVHDRIDSRASLGSQREVPGLEC